MSVGVISLYRELIPLNKHQLFMCCCTGKEGEVVKDKQLKEKGQTFIKRVKFTIVTSDLR